MINTGANVSFAANYRYEASQQRTQRSIGWADIHPPKRAEAPNSPMSSLREAVAQLEHESYAGQSDYQSGRLAKQASQHHARQLKSDGGAELTPEQQRVQAMLEKTFGVKGIKQFDMKLDYSATQEVQAEVQQSSSTQSGGSAGQGSEYNYHEAYREYESSSLAMAGTFTTEDGQAFSFSLDYQHQREYSSTTDVSYRSGDSASKDPLHIDFGGDRGGFGSINKPESLSGVHGSEAKSSLLVQMRLAVVGLQALLAPIIQQDGDQKSKGENNQAGSYLKGTDPVDIANAVNLVA
jgi:hypothetical protein